MDDYVALVKKIREAEEEAKRREIRNGPPDRGTYTCTDASVIFPVQGRPSGT